MDILIIGNGFDLAHGLKTSYKDFLEFCSKNSLEDYTDGLSNIKRIRETNLWFKHFVTRQKDMKDNWIDLEKEIEVVIKYMNKNILPDHLKPTKFPCAITIPNKSQQFSFFQSLAITTVVPQITEEAKDNGYAIYPKGEFDMLYFINLKGFINFLYNQLREFTMAFEQYLKLELSSKIDELNSKYRLMIFGNIERTSQRDLFLLSFNYTDTCERYYQYQCNATCRITVKPFYIHGKISDDNTCNLVLGTKSFKNRDDDSEEFINYEFNVFKKHNQRHKFNTVEQYQELLNTLTDNRRIIKPIFHIIGHSLDETDHTILKHLFQANNNAIINVYYYNEEAQERLINNITNIIGEEEVMTRVRFIDQHDDKRGLLKIKKPSLTCSS